MPFDPSMLAAANPYGAAIGAAAGVLQSAVADVPTSLTSGAGAYQSGPFTVGVRQVGGKGNSAGATTASAQQTPEPSSSGNAVGSLTANTKYLVIGGAALALIVALFYAFRPKKRSK